FLIAGYTGTYDGQAHGLSAEPDQNGFLATGVNGEDLSSQLDLGAQHTNAGFYNETWSFNLNTPDDTTYNPNYYGTDSVVGTDPNTGDPIFAYGSTADRTLSIEIDKALANFNFNTSFVYDGSAHGLSGTASGVETNPADLNGLFHFSTDATMTHVDDRAVSGVWTFN